MTSMLDYLLNFAKNYDITVELVEKNGIIPTCSIPKARYIFLNFDGVGDNYKAFQCAHEIARVLNEDISAYATDITDAKKNLEANQLATYLIFKYTQEHKMKFANLYDFLVFGGIPFDMADYANNLFTQTKKKDFEF